jgi:hypothetical protein
MAHLVIGDDLPLLGVEQPVSLFQTRHDPFDSVAEVRQRRGICGLFRQHRPTADMQVQTLNKPSTTAEKPMNALPMLS